MSGTMITNNSPTPISSFDLSDLSGASGGSPTSATQLLEMLVQELEQILNPQAGGASDSGSDPSAAGGGGSSGGAGACGSSAPAVNSSSAPTPVTGASGGTGASGLSTTPQTAPLSQDEAKGVANQYVQNLQKDFGLSEPQAQGIVANLWHESGGMNSGINQGGKIGAPSSNMADDNNNGYGIAQWGGSRKQGLIDYAQQHGLDPSSQAANYGYLKQELQTTESGAISAVKDTSTAQGATEAFCNSFEQPSDPEMSSRLADLSLIQQAA